MINFDFNKNCYGCSACQNICGTNAITMVINSEGFLIPTVELSKCVDCKMCEKVCPFLNEKNIPSKNVEDKVVSSYRKDASKYREYTSSGIFAELAKRIINNGGKVCGCVWNAEMQAVHVLTEDINVVRKMSYSKYVQSNLENCYKDIKETLNEGKKVLFCGTPCQVAAINNYIKVNRDSLYTVGIVCHGTPSPAVWDKYKSILEDKNKSKMVDANFRYKGKYGWITPFTQYKFENGKEEIKLSFTEDSYVIAFGADILHRNTCYNCGYKGTKSGADIVTGDFWGCSSELLKKSKNKGISSVIIHTDKGHEMMNMLKDIFEVDESDSELIEAENKPIYSPVKYNPIRDKFYSEFAETGNINYMNAMFNRRKYRIKRVLYKMSFFELMKRIKYKAKH